MRLFMTFPLCVCRWLACKSESNVVFSKSDGNFNEQIEQQDLMFHTTEILLGARAGGKASNARKTRWWGKQSALLAGGPTSRSASTWHQTYVGQNLLIALGTSSFHIRFGLVIIFPHRKNRSFKKKNTQTHSDCCRSQMHSFKGLVEYHTM